MLLLSLFSCSCPGVAPSPLYGALTWEGPAGIAWLATFVGPGSLCELSCDDPLQPAIVLADGPCVGDDGVVLGRDEHAGLCVVIPEDFSGPADCYLETSEGEMTFSLKVWEDGRPSEPGQGP